VYAVGTNTYVNCTVMLISSVFQSSAAWVRLEFGGKWVLYFSLIYCAVTFWFNSSVFECDCKQTKTYKCCFL